MRRLLLAASALLLSTTGCADTEEPTSAEANLSPFSNIKDLYEDGKNLDLGDLYSVGAGFATDGLNDALSVTDFAEIKLADTELYATSADAQNDLTLHSIDELVVGLAERFGEKELTTEVNALRADHLRNSSDKVYAETAFSVSVGLHNYTLDTQKLGDDGTARIGFDLNKALEARVIRAHDSEGETYYQAPLSAIKETRGFVMPRSVEDLRSLKPGESTALRGTGTIGLNLGAGIPFLVAEAGAVSYNLVVSAGMRTRLSGEVDVQVVRMGGSEIVVDVGVERAKLDWWKIALEDSWGVTGLVEEVTTVGGVELNIGELVDKTLQKRVLNKIDLVSARVEDTEIESRLSVARFRFDLDAATPGSYAEQAIAQTLRGDLRLAQALSNREEPGVVAEFELSRSGMSNTRYAGLDIFGMKFYREMEEQQGSVVIQTPGGATTINFDTLHNEGGWFFSSHGYTRIGMSGLVFDDNPENPARSEANLIVQLEEGDEYMQRDKLLDHIDGVILGIAGTEAFEAFDETANEVERYVETNCPNSQAFDPCRMSVLDHQALKDLRASAEGKLAASIGHLEPSAQNVVMEAARLRIAQQAAYEPKAQLAGAAIGIVSDFRLDSGSLDHIMRESSAKELDAAMKYYMLAQAKDRMTGTLDGKKLAKLEKKTKSVGEEWKKSYEKHSTDYRVAYLAERYVLPFEPQLGELGSKAIDVRYPVDHGRVSSYEEATSNSLAAVRANAAKRLFDELVEEADDMHDHPEQPAAYSLLMLAPKNHLDLRFDVDVSFEHTGAQSFDQYEKAGVASLDVYGRASAASPIDGGLFDVDQLIDLDQ